MGVGGCPKRGKRMPRIGEIKKGAELGYKSGRAKFVYHACIDCGKERWVKLRKGEPVSNRCSSCAGIKAYRRRVYEQ